MRILFALFALLLITPGCANVCDRKCASEADLFERCLPTWNTTWADQGYADQDAFLSRCSSVWGDGYEATERGSTERRDLEQECTTQLQRAESDTDCQTLLD